MKAKKTTPDFRGHGVEISFNSEEEVYAVYALFNSPPLCEWLREQGIVPDIVREVIKEGADYPFRNADIQTSLSRAIEEAYKK